MNSIITFTASILIWIMIASYLVYIFFAVKNKKDSILSVFVSVMLVWLATEAIKYIFPTLRPFMVSGAEPLTITIPGTGAFPSSHSAISFSLATEAFFKNRRIGYVFFVLAVSVGIARVVAGVHFPLDIVAGALMGITLTYFLHKLRIFKFMR